MKTTLFFSVVQDHSGAWSVGSFMGRNKTEEKRFALTTYKRCVLVTGDFDAARRRAEEERAKDAERARQRALKLAAFGAVAALVGGCRFLRDVIREEEGTVAP